MNTENHYRSIILKERVNLADAIRRGLVWRAGYHGTNLARAGARLLELSDPYTCEEQLDSWKDAAHYWQKKYRDAKDSASAFLYATSNPTKAHALDEQEPRVIREFGR